MKRERYRLKQGGQVVASAEGPGSRADIGHFALVYSEDGPVVIEEFRSHKWREIAHVQQA